MIPQEFIEEVKLRNPIEDVVSSYVTLKRAGSNMVGCCPFHSERTPSFTVFSSTQSCHCFGCGQGGDVINFIRKIENLDYPSAIEFLAKRAGLNMPIDRDRQSGTPDRRRYFEMNLLAARFFREQLFSESGKAALDYLLRRELSMAAIKHFGLGYSPASFGELTDLLRNNGYTDEEMQTAFLCGKSKKTGRSYDYFRNRIMFPIIDVTGNVVAFGGRVMDNSEPKYLNSSDTPIFKKSRNLFALNYAKSACSESIILCEGYMDVIALHNAGFTNAVATLGTAITPEQARIMARYTKKVNISYDSDSAGIRAANRALSILTEVGLEVRVLKYSGAKDPDEFIKKFGADKFRQVIDRGRTRFDYNLEAVLAKYDISLTEERIKACSELCEVISNIPSAVERDIYIANTSEKLEISKESIASDVKKLISKRIREDKKQEQRQIIRSTAGYGDSVNPDYSKNVQAAAAEETVLGLMILYPEFREAVSSGRVELSSDCFITEFGRRVYTALTELEASGAVFDVSLLGEKFSPEEFSRINKYSIDRFQLKGDSRRAFEDAAAVLRATRERAKARDDGGELGELRHIIDKKRRERNKS
jgi:DNA primase